MSSKLVETVVMVAPSSMFSERQSFPSFFRFFPSPALFQISPFLYIIYYCRGSLYSLFIHLSSSRFSCFFHPSPSSSAPWWWKTSDFSVSCRARPTGFSFENLPMILHDQHLLLFVEQEDEKLFYFIFLLFKLTCVFPLFSIWHDRSLSDAPRDKPARVERLEE